MKYSNIAPVLFALAFNLPFQSVNTIPDIAGKKRNEPGKGKPNLLFIMTDQQRFDAMSIAGNKVLETPNMDRIAREELPMVVPTKKNISDPIFCLL